MRTTSLPIILALASLGFVGSLAAPAKATDYTWEGLGFSNNWNDTNGNWAQPNYPGYRPLVPTDTATFGPGTQSFNTIENSSIVIAGITYTAPGYSLSIPGFLTVTNGITATYFNAPNVNVGDYLSLGGTSTIGNLTGAGILNGYGSSPTINIVGSSSTFSGPIGLNTPGMALTVGDGTHAASLTLNLSSDGTNAYAGTTLVNTNAILVAGTAGALAANSNHVINGTLSLSGGSNAVNTLSGSGTVNLTSNTLTINNGGTNFGGSITGTGGSLTKSGTGTLILSGANSYTGSTTISGGRLAVNGSIASGVTVQSGAELGGTGTIGGSVMLQSGGTLAPGSGFSKLTLQSGLILNSGSTLTMEFNSATVGNYDQLDVQGFFAAAGTLQLTIDSGYTPKVGDSFTIFDGATPGFDSGSFNLISSNLGNGLTWDTSSLASTGVVTIAAVPEPSVWGLLLLGVGGICFFQRRRRMS